MSRLLFENSKAALGFAGAIIFGAVVFAGSNGATDGQGDEGDGEVVRSETIANATPSSAPSPAPQSQPFIADFASDEDLIDDASGFDPTPDIGGEIISDEPSSSSSANTSSNRSGSGRPKPQVAPTKAALGTPAIPENAETSGSGGAIEVR
ncbi:MAG: hypothetical protein AAF250_15015 [Pseudomonadota bacterium]